MQNWRLRGTGELGVCAVSCPRLQERDRMHRICIVLLSGQRCQAGMRSLSGC